MAERRDPSVRPRRSVGQSLRSAWRAVRWPAIAALAFTALGLGYWGADLYSSARGLSRSAGDKLYTAFQLFGWEAPLPPAPWPLRTAEFLAPLVTIYTALSAIAAIFREQLTRLRVRLFAADHVVVCGLGRMGMLFARRLSEVGQDIVVIERDRSHGGVPEARARGIVVVFGDGTDETLLRRMRVDRATYVLSVCGDDATNAEVALEAGRIARGRTGRALTVFVHVRDSDLAELLEIEMAAPAGRGVRLEIFNPSERGAPALFDAHAPFDKNGDTPLGPPRILIVGLGQMGSRFLLHAARAWRAATRDLKGRLVVKVVDNKADTHVQDIKDRHEWLEKAVELLPTRRSVEDAEFAKGDFLLDERNEPDVTSAYVCLGDDTLGLAAGLRLQRSLRDPRIQVVVRTNDRGGLASILEGEGELAHQNLHVFGLLDRACRAEAVLVGRTEKIAQAIHAHYVRHRLAQGDTAATNRSIAPWEELSETLRESNRQQADDIPRKLRAIECEIGPVTSFEPESFTFAEEEVERLAREEHDRFVAERIADDWEAGPEKDVDRKQSPYLCSWEELPLDIQDRDRDAIRAIPPILAHVGYQIYRRNGG